MSTKQKIGREMAIHSCEVAVNRAPANLSGAAGRDFFIQVEGLMTLGRAFMVLDFSQVRQLDRDGIYLLLCCLEEAIKCDGNVKLSSVSPEARSALNVHGLNRLFESFETNNDAVSSFKRVPQYSAPSVRLGGEPLPASLSAS
jgi:anti-anti-sigma regulatory factor